MAAVRLLLAAATCLTALQPSTAQWATSATTQPEEIIEPNPIKCECSDVNPRDGVYYNVTYTCIQQVIVGNCGQKFITDTIKELNEGYCQVSCGRCDCCKSVADVLKTNNANSMLQAATVAGLDKQLAAPASMFTLLAPTDEAFAAALPLLGVPSLETAPPETLATILQYHIIPPHPHIDAVWTSPFLRVSNGAPIYTVIPGAPLNFTVSGETLTVNGARNSATIVTPDVEACKSFINIIDAVLLPPVGAKPGTLPISAGNIAAAVSPAPAAAVAANAAKSAPPLSTAG